MTGPNGLTVTEDGELKMLAVFLGAGFSKWAADLPVAAQLFDFRIEPFGVREASRLQFVRDFKEDWDARSPDASAEQFIAHSLASGDRYRKSVLWYVVRRLSEPYIWVEWHSGKWRRHVLMIDENRKLDRPGVSLAQDFLLHTFGGRPGGIITTNYDLLVEYALGSRRFNYGRPGERLVGRGPYPVSQWRHPVTLEGAIPLAKVHGSISWDTYGHYTDGRRGLTGDALIVAPTPEKRAPSILETEWELSARVLAKASCLLVFGFAFNPHDGALLEHLQANGSGVREVMLVDVSPRIEHAQGLWPKAAVRSVPPPPYGQTDLDQWLGEVAKE